MCGLAPHVLWTPVARETRSQTHLRSGRLPGLPPSVALQFSGIVASIQDDTPVTDTSDDARGWFLAAVLILAGIFLPLLAWSHRPLELRTYGEATMAQMRGGWVFKSSYYYASLAFGALLVVGGLARAALALLSRRR